MSIYLVIIALVVVAAAAAAAVALAAIVCVCGMLSPPPPPFSPSASLHMCAFYTLPHTLAVFAAFTIEIKFTCDFS